MSTFRITLRDRAAAILAAYAAAPGNALTGTLVQPARAIDVPQDSAPLVAVHIGSARRELVSIAGTVPDYETTASLTVVATVWHPNLVPCITMLDGIADLVEDALLSSPAFLAAPVRDVPNVSLATQVEANKSGHLGRAVVVLEVRYRETFPALLTDLLETVVVTVQPDGHRTDAIALTLSTAAPAAPPGLATEAGAPLQTEDGAPLTTEAP